MISASQYILGIRPDYNGLIVDPCIPKKWPGFSAVRIWRGAEYQINVKNPRGVNKGIKEIKVNGQKLPGQVIPVFKKGSKNKIEVIMG